MQIGGFECGQLCALIDFALKRIESGNVFFFPLGCGCTREAHA